MSDVSVLRYEVDHEGDISQLVYTFGGVEARASITPGSILDTSSLDCFAGKLHSVHDRVSEVCVTRDS
jgi:amidase